MFPNPNLAGRWGGVAVLSLTLALPTRAQSVGEMTRQQAVSQALSQLSTYSQSLGNVTISAMEQQVAEAARRPKLEIAAAETVTSPALNDYAGTPFSFVSANGVLRTNALLRLRGEFDTSGALGEDVARTDALKRAAAAGSLVARQTLVLNTEQAFYTLSLAQAKVAGSRLNLGTARQLQDVTGLLLQAGEVPGVDLERAQLAVRDRQVELQTNLAGEATARETLRAYLGLTPQAPLAASALPDTAPAPEELSAYSAEWTRRRPEFAQLQAQQESYQHEAAVARDALLPHLTYSVGVGVDTASLLPQGFASGLGLQAQLALLIPFDDGGVADARAKQAEAREQQVVAARSLAERQVVQQYQTAHALAETAVERIARSHENLTQAEHIHRLAVARYRAGEARIIEVTDALNNLSLQRTAWLQAEADYQLALAQLRYAVAAPPPEGPQ
ncbi:hypothetical protein ABS71_07305 [bacterium SCN 62-11]|nr:TolC family protein [Candidatus Eremiobacteraeota bacterium]ODT73367.1 MAG: hypothetical protein ABS71_07305 [bacterium SCN 62-11]